MSEEFEEDLEELTRCTRCKSYQGYSDALVYKIKDLTTKKYYIGSTFHTLDCRLNRHIREFKRFKKGKTHYMSSFEILENDNYQIEMIEQYPCNNKKELDRREGEIIKDAKLNGGGQCVNKNIPGRTIKEYYEKYYYDNLEKELARGKKYRENNFEKIKVRGKKYREDNNYYVDCECGRSVKKLWLTSHKQTQRHQRLMKEKFN